MQRRFRLLVLAILILIVGLTSAQAAQPAAAAQSQSAAAPSAQAPANGQFKVWLQAPHSLAPSYQGRAAAVNALNSGVGTPLSLAAGDFNEDGVQDLVVGYATASGGALAIYRGNLDAFAPQSQASFEGIGRGQFPDPFLRTASVMDVQGTPDFLAAGDFNGDGHIDIVVGSRASATLFIYFGDGHGRFTQPLALALPGPVTALGSESLVKNNSIANLLVGTGGGKPALLVFAGTKVLMSFPMPAAVTSLAFGNLHRDGGPDTALVTGGQVLILRGRDVRAAAAGNFNFRMESVGLPLSAVSVDIGSFLSDRDSRQQMAVMSTDGSVHIVARSGLDPRPWSLEELTARRRAALQHHSIPLPPADPNEGWMIAETFPGAASSVGSAHPPIMMRTRISDHAVDDIAVVDSSVGQMHVLTHANVNLASGAAASLAAPLRGELGLNTPYVPVAALRMRVNIDGRPGFVMLNEGQVAPSVMMPLPDPTFFVNRTDDPTPTSPIANACNNVSNVDLSSSCSLREAVLRANATAGTDTIQLAAGTFTLSRARIANDFTGNQGTLEVTDSVNIVGAGQATTIIQGGTNLTTSVDKVFSFNQDIAAFTNATVSVSNLTIQNGHNRGDTTITDGWGGAFDFDTGGTTPGTGNATLTLTNVTINNNTLTDGEGGGFAIFNTNTGSGNATLTNCIIQNNVVSPTVVVGNGGGIFVSDTAVMTMSNSQVLNNQANTSGSTNPVGGGIEVVGNNTGSQVTIHASTISGNHAGGQGGGIFNDGNLVIDQGTIISNNTSGAEGAGLFHDAAVPDTATLTKVTITGNTATTNGGGIFVGNGSTVDTMTIHFSRLAGNAAAAGSNLANVKGTINATNNWWGTNAAAGTINNSSGGTTTFDPFIVLTHTASPTIIQINQSTTLTGDMSKDNHGNAVGLANLTEILGLPITFDSPVLGSIPQAQPETLNASAQATATFNAGGTGGRGTAHATVDQAVVPVNSNLIASATEAGTTVTITTVGVHGFVANESVVISGVGVGGYNGTFTITGTPTATTFTYTATAGLGASSGGTADVGILILEPLQITKSFVPATVAINASSAATFSITNPNVIAVDASFTDALPATLVVAATPGVTNTCGGAVTAVAGSTSFSFVNASLPVGTCTITVNVSSPSDGVKNNSVTIVSTAAGTGAQSTSSASLTVINPPTIAKAFGAATIPLNGTTSLTFTLSNTNTTSTLNGIAFTDNLPAGLVVATPGNLNSTCSGTATAVDGSSSVSLSGASLAPGASCTISLNVQGTTSGVKNNSVQASSTNAGAGNTSNASVTVVAPPVIIKAFGAASIPLNGSTSLTFTIQNNNTTVSLSGIGFSDTLPAGLVVSTPNGLTGTCGGGTITATAGTNVISLTGATLALSSSCTFSVNVTGTAAGTQNNTTGNLTSTEGGTGGTASASIDVVAPPSIAKAFGAVNIPLNGTTSLTFTITNPAANTVAETGVAFTDTLPTGLVVATPNGLSNTCGGTPTAVAGSTSISLTGGTIATNASCTVVVNITGTTSGQYTNTTGNVSSTNGGTGNTATANLTVATPPTITKSFGAASIPLNGTTSLTFTINNPNTGLTLTGLAFTDNLPAGLVVATPNNLNSTCGGTATAVAGSGSVSLSGGTLASSASCTVSVDVQGTTAGVKNNSVQITSTEGGTGNTSNASITVVAPPVIIKAFGAASIPLNGSTSLTFTIQNNNTTTTLTGIGFSDTLPAGLVVSTPNGLTGSCGGGTITATAATNVISLTGATLAQSTSCTFSVNVTGTAAGTQNNTTGNVTSTEGGTGGTASASINVVAPPSIAKAFGAPAVPLNGTTSLTFTITNPAANAVAETGVAFTDTLPAGIVVATPNGLTNTCGGTATAVAGSGSISLTGGTIAASSTCTVTVNVTGTASGNFTNTTGNVSSTNGGTGNTATANLAVATPPTITKAFGAASVPLNGSTSLTFTINNPAANTIALTGVAFTDNLPAGLVVATPNNLTSTCGGTATAVAGSGSVSLSGGTLAINSSCTLSVNVTGTTAGVKNNSVQVTSTEGGTGNTSNASITVIGPPVIIKAFGAASVPVNGSTSLTFTIQNNNTTQSLSGIGFSDTLPAGLVISTPNGLTGSCGGGTITATQATNVISLTGATLAQSTSCTFAVNVTGTAAGTQNNTTGNVTSTEGGTGGTASASLNVVAPPSIAKAFIPTGIPTNGTSTLTFNITNPAANAVAEAGVAFSDTLPAGMVVATPNGLTNTCGGTATATAGSNSVSLSGGTIAANSTCTVSVVVTASAGGAYNNVSGAVSSTNGGTGNTAAATLNVADPPTITKSFSASAAAQGSTVVVSFTVINSNATTLNGISFTDALPAGLVVANPANVSSDCGGSVTATPGSSSISLSGGALDTGPPPPPSIRPLRRVGRPRVQGTNAAGFCVINVTLLVNGAGPTLSNTTGPVSATESGPGTTSNTATLEVIAAPTLSKSFAPAGPITLGTNTTITFTLGNTNTATTLINLGFNDNLPAGLVVANPNGLAGTCSASVTANPGSNSIGVANVSLAPASSCTVTVDVTAVGGGLQVNTTGQISGSFDDGSGTFIGITGGTATASINVTETAPTITKAFGLSAIPVTTSTTLTLTIHNPNTAGLTGIGFTDALPAGLVVSTPNGLSNTCGGTVVATAGSSSVSLTGGTLAASANCIITLNVTATTTGTFNNTTGPITATESGAGATSNTATLTASDFSVTASPASNTVTAGGSAAYTVTVTPLPAPFGRTVTLSVTGLPLNTVATQIPNPLPGPINAPTNSTLTILTTSNASLNQPARPFARPRQELAMALSLGSLGFLGMVFVGLGGDRRRKRLLWMLLGLVLLGVLLAGCGGTITPGPQGGHGTPPGTYTITITGTASGTTGNLTHSTTVTLVVN